MRIPTVAEEGTYESREDRGLTYVVTGKGPMKAWLHEIPDGSAEGAKDIDVWRDPDKCKKIGGSIWAGLGGIPPGFPLKDP